MGRIYEIFRNLAVSFTKSHYSDTLQNTIHIFPNTKLWNTIPGTIIYIKYIENELHRKYRNYLFKVFMASAVVHISKGCILAHAIGDKGFAHR